VHALLGDGVAASTRSDAQAKSLGEFLRARLVDIRRSLLADEERATVRQPEARPVNSTNGRAATRALLACGPAERTSSVVCFCRSREAGFEWSARGE
jgi:hypothetical protein